VLLAEASRSARLLTAVVQARGELFIPVDAVHYQDRSTLSHDAHGAILRAVEEGDPQAAAAAMEDHLDSSLRDLLDVVGAPALPAELAAAAE
jgi:GntR family transcriptional regulator, transcriptional repressor for pyruvate dehydrogenase complex